MKINLNIRLWVVLVLVGVILALLYASGSSFKRHRATISALDTESTTFESYRLKTQEKASVQAAIILNLDDAIAASLLEQDRLKELGIKRVEVNVALKTRIEVLEKEAEFVVPPTVLYRDTSYNDVDTTLKYIRVPSTIKYVDEWAKLYATVDFPVSTFDTIIFWSAPEITLGWQKQGFMKRKQRSVIYTNENPYVIVTDMKNVIIEEPKKWWQTDVAKVSAGVIIFEVARNLLISK